MKMCADANFEDFLILHHEMGHIQYFMQYKDLPLPFRNSPNPAFHEGIGDTIVLSTVTSQHLYTIGLLDEPPIKSFGNVHKKHFKKSSNHHILYQKYVFVIYGGKNLSVGLHIKQPQCLNAFKIIDTIEKNRKIYEMKI